MNLLWKRLVLALGFAALTHAAQAEEKRFDTQFTFRGVKIAAAAVDSKDKNMSLGFTDGQLMFFTIKSDKFRWFTPWVGHEKSSITSLAFCPDNSLFASAATDGNVKFWDYDTAVRFAEETEKLPEKEARKVKSPTPKKTIKAHRVGPVFVTFSTDGKQLITAGVDGTIKFWNVENPTKPTKTIQAHKTAINCLTLSPDGSLLASGGNDKTARLWRMSESIIEEHVLPDHEGPVLAVAFNQDGKEIATGSGVAKKSGQLRIWDPATGKELYTLKDHQDVVTSICYHPKESRIISGSKDKTLRVWDRDAQKELYKDVHYDPLFGVMITKDGQRIGSFSPEEGKWWFGMPKLK